MEHYKNSDLISQGCSDAHAREVVFFSLAYLVKKIFTRVMTGVIEKHGSHMKLSIDFLFFFSLLLVVRGVGALNSCGGEGGFLWGGGGGAVGGWAVRWNACSRSHQ